MKQSMKRVETYPLVIFSSILLSTAAAYDYSGRPKPVFDSEDRSSFGLGNRVENEPRGSHGKFLFAYIYSDLLHTCYITMLGV